MDKLQNPGYCNTTPIKDQKLNILGTISNINNYRLSPNKINLKQFFIEKKNKYKLEKIQKYYKKKDSKDYKIKGKHIPQEHQINTEKKITQFMQCFTTRNNITNDNLKNWYQLKVKSEDYVSNKNLIYFPNIGLQVAKIHELKKLDENYKDKIFKNKNHVRKQWSNTPR